MKIKFALICLLGIVVSACSSDDDSKPYNCSTCVDTPEASAANDASGKGIYKGLVVGSTGNIKIDISNSGSTISATLTFDGETHELTTTGVYSTGFEGTFSSGDVSFGFYVNNDGTDFSIYNLVIPGHDGATVELFKEKSTELVQAFEGTFSGDNSGVFNMVTRGDEWLVVVNDDDGDSGDSDAFYGALTNGSLSSCTNCGNVSITGKITTDEASGKWNSGSGESGSWKGKRTL